MATYHDDRRVTGRKAPETDPFDPEDLDAIPIGLDGRIHEPISNHHHWVTGRTRGGRFTGRRGRGSVNPVR